MLTSALFLLFSIAQINACNQRSFEAGFVCVCDEDSCDSAPQIQQLGKNDIKIIFTGPSNPGFNEKDASFDGQLDDSATLITMTTSQHHQQIIGFGGEFSDAAGININNLSLSLQQKVLDSYFGDNGIEYSICRVPLTANPFSQRFYTMSDNDSDDNLNQFALQDEDTKYKIPHIKQAQDLRGNKQLHLFGSSSTSPLWMKNHQVWSGGSVLKPENYQAWANYHVKAFDAYQDQGIKFWGMTVGNRPMTGWLKWSRLPSMGWTSKEQATYVSKYLGPAIRNSAHSDLKIMINDDNINLMLNLVPLLLEDDTTLKYIDGTAVQWYADKNFDKDVRELGFTNKKSTFIIQSEASHEKTEPSLGNWTRAMDYINSIITDLEYGYAGWVERNLVLNQTGGPTMFNEPADAPIIISDNFQEFYKQPLFYGIGHFSKYILPGSTRMTASSSETTIKVLSFTRPDNLIVVSVYNTANWDQSVQIYDGQKYSSKIDIPAQSINTILYSL